MRNSSYSTTYKLGEPLSIQYLYRYNGVNPQTGLYEVADLNNDSMIDMEDKEFKLPLQRSFYGGFMNTISYRNLELSFLLQFSKGNLAQSMSISGLPGVAQNQPKEVLNRWRNEGDIATFGKFSQLSINNLNYLNQVAQSGRNTLTNGYYVRLKTVSLSYSLPTKSILSGRIQSARVFVQKGRIFSQSLIIRVGIRKQGMHYLLFV